MIRRHISRILLFPLTLWLVDVIATVYMATHEHDMGYLLILAAVIHGRESELWAYFSHQLCVVASISSLIYARLWKIDHLQSSLKRSPLLPSMGYMQILEFPSFRIARSSQTASSDICTIRILVKMSANSATGNWLACFSILELYAIAICSYATFVFLSVILSDPLEVCSLQRWLLGLMLVHTLQNLFFEVFYQ